MVDVAGSRGLEEVHNILAVDHLAEVRSLAHIPARHLECLESHVGRLDLGISEAGSEIGSVVVVLDIRIAAVVGTEVDRRTAVDSVVVGFVVGCAEPVVLTTIRHQRSIRLK